MVVRTRKQPERKKSKSLPLKPASLGMAATALGVCAFSVLSTKAERLRRRPGTEGLPPTFLEREREREREKEWGCERVRESVR